MYNWRRIKEELINNLKPLFENSTNPTFTNFEEGVEFFEKLVIYKTASKELNGLSRTILPALNKIYVSDKGDLSSLKILSQELEAYLKKIILIKDGNDYTNDHSKSLAPLMEELELSQVLTNKSSSYPNLLNQQNLQNFIGKDEFIEDICRAYIIRNQVHNSPNWTLIEIFTNLNSIVIVYIYATLKHLTILKSKISTSIQGISIERDSEDQFTPHTKMMYDFISYGSSSTEIKKQVIISFILHYLYHNETCIISDLTNKCNEHFNSNIDIPFYRRIIENLENQNKIKYSDIVKKNIYLTDIEKNRLHLVFEDFSFKEQMLYISIKDKLTDYGIENKFNTILLQLSDLLEKNYNIDIYEIYDKGFEVNDNSVNYHSFIKFLIELLNDEEKAKNLFLELLIICEENDFLHKVCASNVFVKFVNPAQLQNYLKIKTRKIYLDTQIILHSLCYWYHSSKTYENIHYKITKDLLDYNSKHSNIKLIVSENYISEAAYQLKEALMLIPFEDVGLFNKLNASGNVFYQFYFHLKEAQELEDDISSLGQFFEGFDLSYEDAFDRNYMHISIDLIREYLQNIGIESFEIPRKSSNSAFDIFKNSTTLHSKSRHEVTISNDAKMLVYLSSDRENGFDSIFTTWDSVFYDARKKYISKFRGSNHWHIFSPAKLLNHLSLLEFEINAESITNEFISILDATKFQENTTHFLDKINTLLDIDKEDRRKYITKLKEFSKNEIIEIDRASENEIVHIDYKPIETLISTLTYHYNKKNSKYSFNEFKQIFESSELFDRIIDVLKNHLDYFSKNHQISENFTNDIDLIIQEYKLSEKNTANIEA